MNVFLLALIIFSFYIKDFKRIFWLAFLAGGLTDLILGDLLGFSSLIFLITCFLLFLYRDKFSASHILFQLVFVILANLFLGWFLHHSLLIKNTVFSAIATLIIFFLINKMKRPGLELNV